MKSLHKTAVLAALLAASCYLPARAATFTIQLNLGEKTSSGGQYLSAEFDSLTQFSSIDSVTLEFTAPDGLNDHGTPDPLMGMLSIHLRSISAAPNTSFLATNEVYASALVVPAGVPQRYGLAFVLPLNAEQPYPAWPDFLFTGMGSIDVVNNQMRRVESSSLAVIYTDTGVLSPIAITDTRLVVEGTAVPEPAAVILMGIGAACWGFKLLHTRSAS